MKRLTLLILLMVSAIGISAQTSPVKSDPPDVKVVAHKWNEHRRPPAVGGDLIRVNDDPFRANDEQREWIYMQKQIARANTVRAQSGDTPIPPATRKVGDDISSAGRGSLSKTPAAYPSTIYSYEVVISNAGKQIRSVEWEYILFDPDTRSEVGNHRFTSEATIASGKSKKLVERSSAPPAQVVDATKAGTKTKGQYQESVVIQRIAYADGSVWERSKN